MKVHIQGDKASYHEQVALCLYPNEKIVYEKTFLKVYDSILNNDDDVGIVAIANSRYGFIPESYSLLMNNRNDLFVIDEYNLQVNQQLLGVKGSSVADIDTVISQSIAVDQCRVFLANQLPNSKIIEFIDTAKSAQLVAEQNKKNQAAIASKVAATIYGLDIIANDIQDDDINVTRFLVIEKRPKKSRILSKKKYSAILETTQKPGSLVATLNVFKLLNINITSLHSSFVPNTEFHMIFLIDYINEDPKINETLIADIRKANGKLSIIGNYNKHEAVV